MASKLVLIVAMALCTGAAGGCQQLGYLLYLFSPPEPTKTVQAEFSDLPDHSVAVIVFTDEKVQCDYPYARIDLSLVVAEELRKRIKGIKVIEPRRIINYQDQNIDWQNVGIAQLGRRFQADYVLFVSLLEYSTREKGSLNLRRGRIRAEAGVYQTSLPERLARMKQWDNISVVHPPAKFTAGLGQHDEEILYKTHGLFAEALVKKFYKHQVPLEET